MNSLSMFEGEKNPLVSFLASVSNGFYVAEGISLDIEGSKQLITLPNHRCVIEVQDNKVTVNRSDARFARERNSVYLIQSIETAKVMTGVLSSLCFECGCKSYKDSDATLKLIYHFIESNMTMENAA